MPKERSKIFFEENSSSTFSSSSESNDESTFATTREVSEETEAPGTNNGEPADNNLQDKRNFQRGLDGGSHQHVRSVLEDDVVRNHAVPAINVVSIRAESVNNGKSTSTVPTVVPANQNLLVKAISNRWKPQATSQPSITKLMLEQIGKFQEDPGSGNKGKWNNGKTINDLNSREVSRSSSKSVTAHEVRCVSSVPRDEVEVGTAEQFSAVPRSADQTILRRKESISDQLKLFMGETSASHKEGQGQLLTQNPNSAVSQLPRRRIATSEDRRFENCRWKNCIVHG